MTTLFFLLILISLLSVLAESVYIRKPVLAEHFGYPGTGYNQKRGSLFLVFLVSLILSFFSGLRTWHNDTYNYIQNFINNIPPNLPALSEISFSPASNPGFFIYQAIIKQFISEDFQIYLLLTAIIVNFLFVLFYYKYSPKFSLSIYIFVASGFFVFTMAAMKQTLAMAVGVWAVHYALRKRWSVFILLLFLAVTIHPYVIFYGLALIMKDKIWSLREYVIIFFTAVGVLYFESFALLIGDVHTLFGEDVGYELLMGSGVNIFRFLIYAVVPIISFIYQKKLRSFQNPLVNVSINFSIMGFVFMFIALWSDPILLGRMAAYFDPFYILALTYIVIKCFSKRQRFAVVSLTILFYSIYFYYQFAVTQPFVYRSVIGTFF